MSAILNNALECPKLEKATKKNSSFNIDECDDYILPLFFLFAGSPKQRVRWRRNQTATIEKHFEKHIRVQRVPRKSECEALRRKYPALATKDWKSIKYKVYNIIQQKKK